jgi:hypothetical protein
MITKSQVDGLWVALHRFKESLAVKGAHHIPSPNSIITDRV